LAKSWEVLCGPAGGHGREGEELSGDTMRYPVAEFLDREIWKYNSNEIVVYVITHIPLHLYTCSDMKGMKKVIKNKEPPSRTNKKPENDRNGALGPMS
jgi:hypothetical protein